MEASMDLFDVSPYTPGKKRKGRSIRPKYAAMPPRVKAALARLKATIDSLPPNELERRRQAFERLEKKRAIRESSADH